MQVCVCVGLTVGVYLCKSVGLVCDGKDMDANECESGRCVSEGLCVCGLVWYDTITVLI